MTSSTPDARRPPLRLRRQPAWLLGGILAVCLGGLASAYLVTTLVHTDDVLLVSATVHRGETIEAGDLAVVSVGAGEELSTVPSTQIDAVVGQTALTDLVAGSLLVDGSYGENPLPPEVARVGVRLAAGRYPTGLVAGSTVQVVTLPQEGNDSDASATTVPATVASAPAEQPDGTVVINLVVAESRAETVSQMASRERVALIETGSNR
ncbi:MAG: SAF domain-containing protein [Propioniciclava sp.]